MVAYKKAIKLIRDGEDKISVGTNKDLYHSKFIVRRDYEILKYYLNHN